MITITSAALGACALHFYLIKDFVVFKMVLAVLFAALLFESVIEVFVKRRNK